jgi:hypothetical protein
MKPYWAIKLWARWVIPLPILLWHARRQFESWVVYQDATHRLVLERRWPHEAGR